MAFSISELLDKAKNDGLGGKKKRPKHGMKSTSIEHLTDGGHVVRHQPYEGDETTYAAKDESELANKIKQYLGEGKVEKEEVAEGDTKKDSKAEESAEKV